MNLEIYKRGQGKYTRIITYFGGLLIGTLIAHFVWSELRATDLGVYWKYGIPLAVFAATAAAMFFAVNRPGNADFMIATEGEMKKVSWSSRKEIVGGTKVVIATTLIMAGLLWGVDLVFGFFFKWIHVHKLPAGE